MNYEKIKETIKEKDIPFMQLCKQVGITSVGLNKALNNRKLYIHILEDISRVIDIPMSYWFRNDSERAIRQLNERVVQLEQENRNLHDLSDYQRYEIDVLKSKL